MPAPRITSAAPPVQMRAPARPASPAPRTTSSAPPVQMGAAARPASPAPRITTTAPQASMPRSMGPKYYSKGGTASARADGIAMRGKTKGTTVKMCGGGMSKGMK